MNGKRRITELDDATTLDPGYYVTVDHGTSGSKRLSLGTLIDPNLSRVGAAADAKETGERLEALEETTTDQRGELDNVGQRMTGFCEELEVDDEGLVYLLNNGERIAGPYGPFAGGGGGGGGGGGSTLTVKNLTGWLSKTIAVGTPCEISLQWSSIEDDIPTGNGTMRIVVNGGTKATMDIAQGDVTVDLAKYLSVGSNTVKVSVGDVYGNTRTINFSITNLALMMESTFDSRTPYTGQIIFPYTPTGAMQKTVHFILDGHEIGTHQTPVSGRQLTYTIQAQSHGSHTLRAYFTAEINGETVRSNELFYDIICLEDGNTTTIITSSFGTSEVMQYDSVQIPFIVYDPDDLTADVTISANGVVVSSQTVDRTEQTYTYRATQAGSLTIAIASGGTTKTLQITVTASDIHVDPETENLVLYLSAQGRSNQEEHPDTWVYGDVRTIFSGFNWVSDGWQKDSDGITVMRVGGSARLAIPYQPFAEDFRRGGKTIEIEFASRDILDYDSTIMSCMSGGRGFTITAQSARLASEQSEIGTQYKEDEHVRLSFVVEKSAENRLLMAYINGVASGVVQYPENDDFSQIEPANILVGASDCTMDIYNIRIYDNNLTRYQILNNWIADTQVGTTMTDRFRHNNVYDEYGKVVIEKLPSDLPYMILECPELPQYKGDKKTVTGSYTDPVNPGKSFTFGGAQADVQGTSSQYYARKNYKIKFKAGFIMPDGDTQENYAINANAVPTNTFTFKADVASSEGANNVELARLYNDVCPYRTPAQVLDPKVRQGIDGFPIVIFWNNGTDVSFLGKYNFNNDKGTEEVFGFTETDESWEILNNTSDRVLWKSDDYTSTVVEDGEQKPAWMNDFEGRYPDGFDDPTQLHEFASWLKSTDRDQATDAVLTVPVTYDGVTYQNDTAEYRLAKFKAEMTNYMEKDSAIFYYLFTELFLMVDSRAKNAFPSFIGTAIEEV